MTCPISRVIFLLLALPGLLAAEYPDAVQTLVDEGLKIETRFEAPGGLAGYVGRRNGRAVSLYLMPDGEHVVVGSMMDGFGQNLSTGHIRTYLPEIDLEGAWAQLEEAAWVAEGSQNPERVVYVFTDPNCGYCIIFREKARPLLERGIQLRHIMVGVIQPSSFAKAASVIAADDPVKQLDFHDNEFPRNWLASSDNIPQKLRIKIDNNNRLMEALSVAVTPSVFYRAAGGQVRKIMGLPDDSALSEAVFRIP